MTRQHRTAILVLLGLMIGGGMVWGFLAGRGERVAEAERDKPIAAPLRVAMVNNEPVVTLDEAAQGMSGIETAGLQPARYQPTVTAYGTVLDLQPLAELASTLGNARAELEVAEAQLTAARAAYERARGLYRDEQNISAAQLQAAQAEFVADQARAAAARTHLDTIASTAIQAWGPALGKGAAERSTVLVRLLDRRDVLVQLTVPPATAVTVPPPAASVEGNGEETVSASLVSAAPRTDPRVQGASFFYAAPANVGLLPGMDVVARLPTSGPLDGVAVPDAAVVWLQGQAWVYVRTGPETFARRPIATDRPIAAGGVFVDSLPQSAQVVVKGGQLLLSEEFRARIKVDEE